MNTLVGDTFIRTSVTIGMKGGLVDSGVLLWQKFNGMLLSQGGRQSAQRLSLLVFVNIQEEY